MMGSSLAGLGWLLSNAPPGPFVTPGVAAQFAFAGLLKPY
jgi:hypothetical protein